MTAKNPDSPFGRAFTYIKQCVVEGVDFDSRIIFELATEKAREIGGVQTEQSKIRARVRNWKRQIEQILHNENVF